MKTLQCLIMPQCLAVAFCLLTLGGRCAAATGQEEGTPAAASSPLAGTASTAPLNALPNASPSTPSLNVEESKPAIYYLPDKEGKLQPVLDFSYQDFADLYKLKNQFDRRERPPLYSIQRVSISGTAKDNRAELSLQFQIVVRDDDWVCVPLRLNQALLRGAPEYRGEGKHFVDNEGGDGGYVCWIRGKANSQHEITLSMLAPLESIGEETRLNLYVPRATASELKLAVPVANAVGSASEGATLLPAVFKNDATEFTAAGLTGNFQLMWRRPTASDDAVALDVSGTALAKLDGHAIVTEAVLSVRSHGAAFDHLTVRLPPEMDLVAGKADGAVIAPAGANGNIATADANEKTGKSNGQRLVEVRFSKKTLGPVDIQLTGRRSYDPIKNQAWCELAGFEVVGATRQWGVLAVAAGSEWQTLWGASRETRQIDQLPESLRKEDTAAGFEYSSQPYSLPIRLTPRKTRVSVEPEYVVTVERNQAKLEGKLRYTIRGAKIATLEIAIPGWELDDAGPEELVAAASVAVESDVAFVPLDRATSGTVELQLHAHRAIPPNAKLFSMRLPRPQGCAVGPASLSVTAADNVELIPNPQAIEGLVRQRTPSVKKNTGHQEPLFYRGLGGDGFFAADFRIHAGRITVEAAGRVQLAEHAATVEQTFNYSVAFEQIDQLSVAVPRVAASHIQAKLNGSTVSLPITVAKAADDDAAFVSAVIALPEPRFGDCSLTLDYSVPLVQTAGESPTPISVPLAMPKDGELLSNAAAVKAVGNICVSSRPGPWSPSYFESDGVYDLQLAAAGRADSLELTWQHAENNAGGAVVVERALVQSWFSPTAREDRAVFQIAAGPKELEVLLPAGATAAKTATLVDGHRVEPRAVAERRMMIPLGRSHGDRSVVVELQYHFADVRPMRSELNAAFPQIQPAVWIRRLYWQLMLPANEHVLASPGEFTSEMTWRRHFFYWERTPVLNPPQLEAWAGASPRDPLPNGVNVYLFSAVGNVAHANVFVASRTWLVFWASGAVLIAGLLFLYIPRLWHPALLLALSVALAAAALAMPESSLLASQAAVAGVALVALAAALHRVFIDRGPTVRADMSHVSHSYVRPETPPPNTVFVSPSSIGNVAPTEIMPTNPSPSKGSAAS